YFIGNKVSRSHISSYLVAVSNLFQNQFIICSKKTISGPNGHGPLDYALVTSISSKLSKQLVVVYRNDDMEDR
ncbi:4175_t:CDS:2, partial [Gigaspora rosea]